MSTTASCTAARADLSARLDREPTLLPVEVLDAHVAGCADCAAWLAAAERITRQSRLRAVGVPDLTERILTAVATDRAAVADIELAAGVRRILRLAVGIAAAVQFVLALPVLFGVGVDPHASREMASFDIAVAVGFALAAWRPDRARAFVPVAFVLAACLAVTSALDLSDGATHIAHEVGHLAALAQAGLLWALGRRTATPHSEGVPSVRVSTPSAS